MAMKMELILGLILLMFTQTASGQKLEFIETNDVVLLQDCGKPIYTYQKSTKSLQGKYPRANYLHPLYDFQGKMLTEDFPEDHPHQRGVFWAWHQLFVDGKRIGDPWLCQGMVWEVDSVALKTDENRAILEATVYWSDEKENKNILKENLKIEYRRPDDEFYILDFEIVLNALVDKLQIGGSEDEKGYGGFSVRLKTKDGLVFFGENGQLTPRTTTVDVGNWIDVREEKESCSGVVILCDTTRIPNFQGWILRRKNSMQNPAFPGRELIDIRVNEPLVIKNRLIVYQNRLSIQQWLFNLK